MRINVGIDIAKEIHWVIAIDADGGVQGRVREVVEILERRSPSMAISA